MQGFRARLGGWSRKQEGGCRRHEGRARPDRSRAVSRTGLEQAQSKSRHQRRRQQGGGSVTNWLMFQTKGRPHRVLKQTVFIKLNTKEYNV